MSRLGMLNRCATSVAASASVGETTAPSVNAAAHESPIALCATTATPPVVTSTRPIASSEIGRMFARRSRRPVKNAAE